MDQLIKRPTDIATAVTKGHIVVAPKDIADGSRTGQT